jgi:hypothetical protein
MTDGQSASLSWNKAPIWGLRPNFCYCQTVAGLLMWGALSDERTSLSFTIVVGPRQRSHSRVLFPWDSRPYFTVSDWRLPFSSPPTTRRFTVEVFDPASTRDCEFPWINEMVIITCSHGSVRVEWIYPIQTPSLVTNTRDSTFWCGNGKENHELGLDFSYISN